jgi:hypothetical protein
MMADERVTTYVTPAGSKTAVIYEGPARSDNGAGWLFGFVLLVAVLAVAYLMAVRNDTRSAKDYTAATAAIEVGTAAANTAGNLTQK